MRDPKISIVIPVYNGSNYLANAIDCALGQSYENIEVIVVNDGSNDNGETERVALSYGDRIRYYLKENGGVSSSLNFGIEKMTGDYFSWLSHDDAYSADKVKDSVDLLRRNGMLFGKCIAFTGGFFIDSYGHKINDFQTYFKKDKVYSGIEVINVMTKKGTLNGCCMLIPKNAFSEVAIFHEGLRYSQDSLMWYQLFLADYSIVSDNKPNVMYRLHRNQTSQLRRDLYEHDSRAISEILAGPLYSKDSSGELLFRYIKRLTKYHSTDAIDFLCDFAKEQNVFSNSKWRSIKVAKSFGFFRYKIVSTVKKMMLKLRR